MQHEVRGDLILQGTAVLFDSANIRRIHEACPLFNFRDSLKFNNTPVLDVFGCHIKN